MSKKKDHGKITIKGISTYLGRFQTPSAAIKARNKYILENNLQNEYPIQ